jgi:hypothetical protein
MEATENRPGQIMKMNVLDEMDFDDGDDRDDRDSDFEDAG